jgi:hypothetical protein
VKKKPKLGDISENFEKDGEKAKIKNYPHLKANQVLMIGGMP